jgi:hypothetical protein
MTQARRTDPATSHDAARAIAPSLGIIQSELLAAIARYPQGLTPDEAEDISGLHHGARRRISELAAQGLIVPTGATRPGRSGRAQRIFVVAPKRSIPASLFPM